MGKEKFYNSLAKSFEFFEKAVQDKKIKTYGLATWLAFRSPQDEDKIHLNLQEVVNIAKKVAGD